MAEIAILIPALDCAATIGAVVAGARHYVSDVLVVSDGSRDDTAALASGAGAEVVRHEATQGKGAALQTGMRVLVQRGFDRVLTMDGDGQHMSEQIPALLAASSADPEALIIGVRQVDTALVTPMRGFGNRFANRWVEIACGQVLPDTQSGFRIYPLAATLALQTRAQHFAFETEVLIRAARAGMTIHSIPVRSYQPPPEKRISHFRPVLDTIRIIFVVLGLIFRLW